MICGITMVKDEADILESTITHLLKHGVDYILAYDNLSTDGTTEILDGFDGDVTWWSDPEVGYHQSAKMSRLARIAGEGGYDWIVPFDADEIWHLPGLDAYGADAIEFRSHVYLPRFADPEIEDPIRRMQWRFIEPEQYPKVAFRWQPGAELAMGNHSVALPQASILYDTRWSWDQGFRIRHYQYRDLDQVRRKIANGVAAYAATSYAPHFGAHWKWLASLDEAGLQAWWDSYLHLAEIVCDPYEE